jgi:nitrate/nitrite-specific signal transduction histidine kinase
MTLGGLVLALTAARAWAKPIADINEAINKAGRLRMLSQRIAKVYCQIGQGILPDAARKILAASISLYDEHLESLRAYAPTPDIRATYDELASAWRGYRDVAAAPPTPAGAKQVAVLNENVLRLAHLGTTQLELHSGSNLGRLINISGRQRMLSQRLAKFYMLRHWGITSPEMDSEARVARGEFISALDALGKAKENTTAIAGELELAKVQWLFFDQALQSQRGGGKDDTDAQNVATTSERILEVMDRITGMYAKLNAGPAPAKAPEKKR